MHIKLTAHKSNLKLYIEIFKYVLPHNLHRDETFGSLIIWPRTIFIRDGSTGIIIISGTFTNVVIQNICVELLDDIDVDLNSDNFNDWLIDANRGR